MLFLELRDGHVSLDEPSHTPGMLGPVIGPFIAARILRDEVRVTTTEHEYPLQRFADWIFYDGKYFSDLEIVASDQMGPGRTRRRRPFVPSLAQLKGVGARSRVTQRKEPVRTIAQALCISPISSFHTFLCVRLLLLSMLRSRDSRRCETTAIPAAQSDEVEQTAPIHFIFQFAFSVSRSKYPRPSSAHSRSIRSHLVRDFGTIHPQGSATTSASSGRALPPCNTAPRTRDALRFKPSRKARIPIASLAVT